MTISNNILKNFIFGACNFKEPDGYLTFNRYTDEQIAFYKFSEFYHTRANHSTGITIEFESEANELSFEYKSDFISSDSYTIDVYVNGMVTVIENEVPNKTFFSCTLPDGKKKVVIYLPGGKQIYIKNFQVDKKIFSTQKNENVLWIGDSITQGYGPSYTSFSYVNIVNRKRNYNLLNQGIGGTGFKKIALSPIHNFTPEKIIVSLGTNVLSKDTVIADTDNFFKTLRSLYPSIPILAITPVWRGDEGKDFDYMKNISDIIKNACKKQTITVIDGYNLIPHLKQMYLPDLVHPNTLGCMHYAENLLKELEKLDF